MSNAKIKGFLYIFSNSVVPKWPEEWRKLKKKDTRWFSLWGYCANTLKNILFFAKKIPFLAHCAPRGLPFFRIKDQAPPLRSAIIFNLRKSFWIGRTRYLPYKCHGFSLSTQNFYRTTKYLFEIINLKCKTRAKQKLFCLTGMYFFFSKNMPYNVEFFFLEIII